MCLIVLKSLLAVKLAGITSREVNAEQKAMVLKTELSMFEATALGRNDEVAEMQLRLSQGPAPD